MASRIGGDQHQARTDGRGVIGGPALPALSPAGIPPFSGFVAKLALVDAGLSGGSYAIVAVALVGSLLTVLSMTKFWIGAFWRTPTDPVPASAPSSKRLMYSATGVAVAGTIAVAVLAGPLWEMSETIAIDLLDRQAYVSAVLP